jgi:hypothetical protein
MQIIVYLRFSFKQYMILRRFQKNVESEERERDGKMCTRVFFQSPCRVLFTRRFFVFIFLFLIPISFSALVISKRISCAVRTTAECSVFT